ncbi:cobalt-precorrin-5B (C(1))-methyltransferase [Desulfotalea psychrophila]|uniref:Cobalt-precorrin-5B C(1)-methyltransferase n=1 Tax=Desulfotalea psychrophila (strain LSv54 / DSM 12343) TaxID=177439 RepID=CBID_DESPS|nr:cobalt-precorrin-5B (C(1))-methyltransferase [Desulfotalea psychrophila]Q6ARS6.1 RecName: Full=Cobalt-precorrin-5B C(1)-methyltransferase; AltName: Full=Cobalt-precorrin-6A synthase [Desulfotalea psychrophila LSv54]CAG34949.1 probable cobalamin biosynthesis protein (CbiD) [Desulfotalea psychrophila LSv54]
MSKAYKRPLRSGYTTGACAAAVAKGATILLLSGEAPEKVEIPFPDGSRHSFCLSQQDGTGACMGTIKDAGDDPDVTNGALILATASWEGEDGPTCVHLTEIRLCGGDGVGQVSKRGLSIAPGEPAINPVPRQMIEAAVAEALSQHEKRKLTITISVPQGLELAEKTLNHRLGIVNGISILGTTGIVRPISASAWKATISACMDVARSAGLEQMVISTGRTSEKGAQQLLDLPEEAYAMMGDYLQFSLEEAGRKGFSTIHYAGMWAKIIKAALEVPQTHVRNGALEVEAAAQLLKKLGADEELCKKLFAANTAREMLSHLEDEGRDDLVKAVCQYAKKYAEKISEKTVHIYLINHRAEVIHYE